ncbi:hypothetical protein J3R30DRAFT_3522884 [Lentinula aciculospora]|uniref:Uncharacterized protein n=1 Tax=Lentinula aciculospora TaxID=153920 RepID=A0A9W9DIE3_9AGAR|nr:hypothetical protein J3R30DRAFT_3522884 [Lentinula aciculospora]
MQNIDNTRDDNAAQLRFESFKLGRPLPASMSLKQQHRHSRSHSRNASISSVASLPIATSKSTNSYDFSALPTTNSMPVLSSQRNSHHRRRSSVSTRHESAEIMGLPDFPASSSEDHVVEKDSVRRRALWALEGKQDDISYSKVEIPELSTAEVEKKMFAFSPKSLVAPSNPGYSSGLSTLMSSKRDSFKPSSSKDQLHTLVEEEEEDDWDAQKSSQELTPVSPSNDVRLPITPATPDTTFAKRSAPRPRPTTLTLRPLSLTADSLPAPSSTPSVRSGLRSLSLVPNDEQAIASNNTAKRNSVTDVSSTPHVRARPINLQITTSVDETPQPIPTRRSSISYKSSSAAIAGLPTPEMTPTFAERRYSHSSLSSLSSVSANGDEDFLQSNASYSRHRPLSASEQHFLFKSHNALLSRIQDLEKALSVRRTSISSPPGSRPLSSSFSVADSEDMSISSEPSDEMLRLVADLKAERDELKRDVDGWRVRVGDLEKQIGLLGKRVEGERREAWVARSRVNLVEAEKNAFEKELGRAKDNMRILEEEKDDEITRMKSVIRDLEADKEHTVQENARLLEECERWKLEASRLSKMEKDVIVLSTVQSSYDPEPAHNAWRRGLHYDSVDSLESSTDVDFGSFDSDNGFDFSLKAVIEEHEEDLDVHCSQIPEEDVEADYISEEEDNELAGYEDEEEEDLALQSSDSFSSFGSINEAPNTLSVAKLQMDVPRPVSPVIAPLMFSSGSGTNTPSTLTPGSRSPSSSPVPAAASSMGAFKFPHAQNPAVIVHRSVGSLSKTWTFPKAECASTSHDSRDDVDKFFNCLEDAETDSTGSRSPVSPSIYTYEHNKGLFAKGLEAFDDDEVMPFALPSNIIGTIAEELESPRFLPVLIEEEEGDDDDEQTRVDDNDDMFGDIAGIKITFTPAADDYDDEYSSSHVEDSGNEDTDDEEKEEIDETAQQERTVNIQDTIIEPPSPLRFSSVRKPVPILEESNDEDLPFSFGNPLRSSTPMSTPPRASVRAPSPSSIPRPSSSFNSSSFSNAAESSPMISPSKLPVRSSSFVTPPTKRGGASPSFIPQAVSSSPNPKRKGPSVREKPPVASFIRQPMRRPLIAGNNANSTSRAGYNDSNVGGPIVTNDTPRFSSSRSAAESDYSFTGSSFSISQSYCGPFQTHNDGSKLSGLASISTLVSTSTCTNSLQPIPTDEQALSDSFSSPSLSSIMTSPKLSFQTIAGFIPRSWSTRPSRQTSDQDDERAEPSTTPASAKFRPYASKQKQLERLRLRLQREGPTNQYLSNDVCQKCDGGVVYI